MTNTNSGLFAVNWPVAEILQQRGYSLPENAAYTFSRFNDGA
jgi:hypothetical protein